MCNAINQLAATPEGVKKLYMVTWSRGGFDKTGSCIWADVEETAAEQMDEGIVHPIKTVKQVFGHTLLAFDTDEGIVYGDPIEAGNMKMLDTHKAFELAPKSFTITPCK